MLAFGVTLQFCLVHMKAALDLVTWGPAVSAATSGGRWQTSLEPAGCLSHTGPPWSSQSAKGSPLVCGERAPACWGCGARTTWEALAQIPCSVASFSEGRDSRPPSHEPGTRRCILSSQANTGTPGRRASLTSLALGDRAASPGVKRATRPSACPKAGPCTRSRGLTVLSLRGAGRSACQA